MNNRGLFNHYKFRTKYWQEKHQKKGVSYPSGVAGTQIAPPHPRTSLSPHSASSPRPYLQKGQGQRLKSQSRTLEVSPEQYKWSLKKQLLELSEQNFTTIRPPDRYNNVRSSNLEHRSYLGKNYMEKQRRPHSNSVTLELKPGTDNYRLEQRFSAVERKHNTQFLPAHSLRLRPLRSPIF